VLRVNNFGRYLSAIIILAFSTSSFAKMIDENEVKAVVKEELTRLLNSDEIMGPAIENFIKRQAIAKEKAQQEQQQARAKNIRPVDPKRDHIKGKTDAPLTIIEYSDFECPFCKRFHPTVSKLLENNPDKLRWVYRHFPLGFHDPGATKQAEATECVAELGGNDKFWAFSDEIYKRTKSNGKGFPLENLKGLAIEQGIDGDAFEKCLSSGKFADKVQEDIANGKKIGVSGTPAAFILNSKGEMRFVAGALPLNRLQRLVDDLSQ